MSGSREQISPERLWEAAEASLRAAADVAEYTGGPAPYPADLMGSPLQPDGLAPFTKFEVEEACAFLVRMGILMPPRPIVGEGSV
jgi:hypothetical protein